MHIVWSVLEAAEDAGDEIVIAACRRLIEAHRLGWRKHHRRADWDLVVMFYEVRLTPGGRRTRRRMPARLRAVRRGQTKINEERASLDRGAEHLRQGYCILESEEFAHLPLSEQQEFRDRLCELEELLKSVEADDEDLAAKYRILRAIAVSATAKHPDLQRQLLAILDSDDD